MSTRFLLLCSFLGLAGAAGNEGCAQDAKSPAEIIQRFDRDGDQKLDATELGHALATWRSQPLEFIRITKNERRVPQTLETSIVRFASPDGQLRVDLIGAIHVADKSYFAELNRLFRNYDVVLYELIAPEGTRIPAGGRADNHPVSKFQTGLKSMLDLSFQLDEIDYGAEHLVHADLSPQQFAASMKQRGESFWQILARLMGQASAQAGRGEGPNDRELFFALFARNRPLRLKRILAEQFADLDSQMEIFTGPEGSTLITERNKRALQVLQEQIRAGQDHLGIFYGAGHLPDMAARLQAEFGLIPVETRWLVAWNLAGEDREKPAASNVAVPDR